MQKTIKGFHWYAGIVARKSARDEKPLGNVHTFVASTCLKAMEEGALDVHAQASGMYLWEIYMPAHLVPRLCALRPRLDLLWVDGALWGEFYYTAEEAIALTQMEYLWQDLSVVQRYVCNQAREAWVGKELRARQTWCAGLRRAWILATMTSSFF
jgi:hypothetical protein